MLLAVGSISFKLKPHKSKLKVSEIFNASASYVSVYAHQEHPHHYDEYENEDDHDHDYETEKHHFKLIRHKHDEHHENMEFGFMDGCILAYTFNHRDVTRHSIRFPPIIKDITGHDNNGIMHHCKPSPGKHGGAVHFNGFSSYIEMPALDEKTIAFWYKSFSKSQMGIYDGGFIKHDGKSFQIGLYQPKGFNKPNNDHHGLFLSFWKNACITPFKPDSEWHHIIITWDGQRTVSMLIDGKFRDGYILDNLKRKLQKQPFRLAKNMIPNHSQSSFLGKIRHAWWDKGQTHFSGLIDEFAVWDRPLNHHEMLELYEYAQKGKSYCEVLRE